MSCSPSKFAIGSAPDKKGDSIFRVALFNSGVCNHAYRDQLLLEGDLSLELDQPRGSVATQERTQDAGWGIDLGLNRAKTRVGRVIHRQVEVGMVEKVEHLQSDLKLTALPVRDGGLLRETEVGV